MNRNVRVLVLLALGLMILLSVSQVFAQDRPAAPQNVMMDTNWVITWDASATAAVEYYVVRGIVRVNGEIPEGRPGWADYATVPADAMPFSYTVTLPDAHKPSHGGAFVGAVVACITGTDGAAICSPQAGARVDSTPLPAEPAAPMNVMVNPDFTVTWDMVAGASGYSVTAVSEVAGSMPVMHMFATNSGMLYDDQIPAAGSYMITVAACNLAGCATTNVGAPAITPSVYAMASPHPAPGSMPDAPAPAAPAAPAAAPAPRPVMHTCQHLSSNIVVTVSEVGPQCLEVSGGGIGI